MHMAQLAILTLAWAMPAIGCQMLPDRDASSDPFPPLVITLDNLDPNLLRPAAFRFMLQDHTIAPDSSTPFVHFESPFNSSTDHPTLPPATLSDIALAGNTLDALDLIQTFSASLRPVAFSYTPQSVQSEIEFQDPGLTPLTAGTSIWNLPLGDGVSLDGRGWRREIDDDERVFVVGAEAKVGLTYFLDLRMGYEVLRTQSSSIGIDSAGDDGIYAQFRFRF